MAAFLLDFLRSRPDGARPEEVARDFLKLDGPPDFIRRIVVTALREAGAAPGPDGRWFAPGHAAPRAVAVEIRATGPHPPYDQLLAVGAAPIVGGRIGSAVSAFVRPDRPLAPSAVLDAGVDPRRLDAGRPLSDVLELLGPLLDQASVVAYEFPRAGAFFARLLLAAQRPERPGPGVVLAPALRRAGLVPPKGGIEEAAGVLRTPAPVSEDPADRAQAVAALYLAALERGVSFAEAAPRPRFDFGRTGFGAELLAELPPRPGIYRFYDRDGRLLYIGKSRDLKSRVSFYFSRSVKRRKREQEMLERIHRMQWEETGSELEALLKEIREIREFRPPYNIQTGVRRRRPSAGDLVLFLPAGDPNLVELFFVREGEPAGRLILSRKHAPAGKVRKALEETFATPRRAPSGDTTGARILASWLRSKGDTQNHLDLSETGGIENATDLICFYVTDPDLFTKRFFQR